MSGNEKPVGWNELTVTPDDEAVRELRDAWAWLLPEEYRPALFSALGDMFFETASGDIHWLNTGTAEVSRVADNMDSFRKILGSELVDELFLPPLIEKLIAAGKRLDTGQCYCYITLPVFEEGTYTVENLAPVSMEEHFRFTGLMHEQLQNMPEGAKIRIRIVD